LWDLPVQRIVEDQPGDEEAKDLKAKLTKVKRQAITLKSKLAEATAARDAAIAELEALNSKVYCCMYILLPVPCVQSATRVIKRFLWSMTCKSVVTGQWRAL
jgi:hypothetical protein